MMIECPHCHMETEHKVIDHINIDRNPELRAKVQDLSVFRVKCPNCGETVLAVHLNSSSFMISMVRSSRPRSRMLIFSRKVLRLSVTRRV